MRAVAALFAVSFGACVVNAPPPDQPAPGPAGEQAEGPPPDDGEPYAAPATGEGEIVCAGSEDIEIIGKTIESPTNGLVIAGSCDVVIENSVINAAEWAIVISGSGDVKITDSVIQGGAGSVNVSGSGDIEARGTRFIGRMAQSGSADFSDLGGNSFDR